LARAQDPRHDPPPARDQLRLDDLPEPSVPPGTLTLVGVLERITFANADNGFVIGRVLAEGQREPVTVKGVLGAVREGETLKLWGSWEEHPTYGLQFAVSSSLVLEPTTLEGIERYLEANIDGVGRKLAKRIVKTFGHETFDVIDREPEKLLEVPKFSRKALESVRTGWQAQKVKREMLVFLHSVGVSPLFAERIFQAYGIGSVEAVKDNPYRLALDIQGIGFRTADLIALRLGVERTSPRRAEAGALYALEEAGGEGHTGLPRGRLVERAAALLEVSPALVDAAVGDLLAGGLLKTLDAAEEEIGPLAADPEALVFRNRFHRAEQAIVAHLERLSVAGAFTRFPTLDSAVASMERESGIYLSDGQRAAVEQALGHKVLVITGGPGTGKTTIIRFILGLVAGHMPSIALAAPTGKAAKRLAEATGRPASTIHRLLEAGPKGFQRNADRPVEVELLIVDESSMIDTLLMEALLSALPDHARLVLVGDVDQLPSVGPGQVLSDLIGSARFPVARLETVFRQSERSRITANAHAIRRGELPDLSRPADGEQVDFYFLPEADPARIVDKIRTLVLERIPEAFGFDPRSDVQVLSPMHRGLTGAQNLNRMLQQWLNPDGREIGAGDPVFRVGDRVMQTRNDYDHEVFNGDMGEIVGFDPEAGTVSIDFDGHGVEFERRHLEHLTLGYTITVHKSQGSEYPAVVLPLTTHHSIMLQRNLLYTAITRGRRLVVVVGTERALAMAVHNARPTVRHTGLKARLTGSSGIGGPRPAAGAP
jgi:exodeoxyribonuclease V alpha subunit